MAIIKDSFHAHTHLSAMSSRSRKSSSDHDRDSNYDNIQDVQASSVGYQPLSHTVYARRSEYTRPTQIKVKVGTWNVAACSGVDKDVGAWFVEGKGFDKHLSGLKIKEDSDNSGAHERIESVDHQEHRAARLLKLKRTTVPENDHGVIPANEEIGLYVLGLQEVVELSAAKEYIGKLYSDSGPLTRWKKAMQDALPKDYTIVSEQQLSGLVLLIYASPQVAPTISSVSSVSVGTGVMGYLGNKGGVITRILLGETTRLAFINSHLASGTDAAHLDRRCWDAEQILARTKFDPINRGGVLDDHIEGIGDEDFAFWFGDLNFRLEGLPGEDIRRLLMLHTKGEYGHGTKSQKNMDKELSSYTGSLATTADSSSDNTVFSHNDSVSSIQSSLPDPDDFDDHTLDPHEDPTSLQATLDSLLPHDQLTRVRAAGKAFHDGWREGPITFLPTYRYDVGSVGMFDSSEKKRTPSWCDRILYRTRRDKLEYDGKSQEKALARLKDEEMKARGIDHASEDEEILYDYDPESDGDEQHETYFVDSKSNSGYDEYHDSTGEIIQTVTQEGFLDTIKLDVYTSHQRVLSSDHKPVDAVFTLTYDAVVPELKSKIQQEVARDLDRAENEGRPSITVVVDHSHGDDDAALPEKHVSSRQTSRTNLEEGVDFGEVSYLNRKRRGLTIANTGQSSASFCFMSRPVQDGEVESIAPSWLTLRITGENDTNEMDLNRQFSLEPGETVNVSLGIYISDIRQVRSLNARSLKLDDVLVLRVTEGRDHFVPVRAFWLQSCFGRSIVEMIRIPDGGVRALPVDQRSLIDTPVHWSAPRELFKLTEASELLTERTLAEKGMIPAELDSHVEVIGWPFESSSWSMKDSTIRDAYRTHLLEALDTGKPLIECFPPDVPAFQKLEIVAETLILFISNLSDGIIPSPLWTQIDQTMEARKNQNINLPLEDEKSAILDTLSNSPNHNISLVFLTAMLGKVASDLAPVTSADMTATSPTSPIRSGSTRMSLDQTLRRSLSFKSGKSNTPTICVDSENSMKKRQAVYTKFADIFGPIICRGEEGFEGKAKRNIEEKQKRVVKIFLQSTINQSAP